MWSIMNSKKRVEYLRKNNIFGHIGENVLIMDRKIPLYANLIKIHNNVKIASNVTFITHYVTHSLLNNMQDTKNYKELIGCIEIMDNVFIGANSPILSNVLIGNNVIVVRDLLLQKTFNLIRSLEMFQQSIYVVLTNA